MLKIAEVLEVRGGHEDFLEAVQKFRLEDGMKCQNLSPAVLQARVLFEVDECIPIWIGEDSVGLGQGF